MHCGLIIVWQQSDIHQMNQLLEAIAEVVLSGFVPSAKQDGIAVRVFVLLTMGIAGICFLIYAGVAFARHEMIVGIIFIALAALCLWLFSRARRR
jgi:hypothetical protein